MSNKAPRGTGEIHMEARLVEARGGPWSPLPESFHDRGVALDYVQALEPSLGPTVVFVYEPGSAPPSRPPGDPLLGWWLCERGERGSKMSCAASRHRPRRPRIPYRGPLVEWESARDGDAASMLAWAAEVGVPGALVSLAALDCAAEALSRDPDRLRSRGNSERAASKVGGLLTRVYLGSAKEDDAGYVSDSLRVGADGADVPAGTERAMLAASLCAGVAKAHLGGGPIEPAAVARAVRACSLAMSAWGPCHDAVARRVRTLDFLRACAGSPSRAAGRRDNPGYGWSGADGGPWFSSSFMPDEEGYEVAVVTAAALNGGAVEVAGELVLTRVSADDLFPRCASDLAALRRRVGSVPGGVLSVSNVRLHPWARGRGVGAALYAEAARVARERFDAAIVAGWCVGGQTSAEARRVWSSSRLAEAVDVYGSAAAARA